MAKRPTLPLKHQAAGAQSEYEGANPSGSSGERKAGQPALGRIRLAQRRTLPPRESTTLTADCS